MKTERQKDYAKYLCSEHWKNKKIELRKAWGDKCCVCGKKEILNFHHVNYDNLGNETIKDVVLVCRGCHIKIHKGKLKVWVFSKNEYKAFQEIKHIVCDNTADYITFFI